MATVLLITETKLKAFSTLNQNIDMALLTSCIYMAQELGLQTLIGTKGYDYYMNLVKSVQLSGGTMSQPDSIMLNDYIAPYLIHRAFTDPIPLDEIPNLIPAFNNSFAMLPDGVPKISTLPIKLLPSHHKSTTLCDTLLRFTTGLSG